MLKIKQIKELLFSFTSYPTGWRFGSGVPANSGTIRYCQRILGNIDNTAFANHHVSLAENGSVVMSFRNGRKFIEVIVSDASPFEMFIENDADDSDEFKSFERIDDLLNALNQLCPNSLEYLGKPILLNQRAGIAPPPFYQMVEASPFSQRIAQIKNPKQFAATFKNTIPHRYPTQHQFIGSLKNSSQKVISK